MKNEMTDGMVYSKEMGHYVGVVEWLQHVKSVSNTLIQGFEYNIKFTTCTDVNGKTTYEPYISVGTQYHGQQLIELLRGEDIVCELDLYEDDDGDGDYGRPIIRKIWSVRFPEIVLDYEPSI